MEVSSWLWPHAPELCRLGASELSEAYRSRALSPVEVAEACLERAQKVDAVLNAFTFIDEERALEQARESEERWRKGKPASSVDGVPATVKDTVWVKEWPLHFGSSAVQIDSCAMDAPSVERMRRAGSVFLGQTTTPEFGWKAVTESARFGTTLNPWNPALTPGGSSGGAAVAAATGAGVFHVATDGGGSIRIPAAFSGVCGLKPTFGRVPAYPLSVFGTVAHLGPIARHTNDLAAMLLAMSGPDSRDWPQGAGALDPVRGTTDIVSIDGMKVLAWRQPASGPLAASVQRVFEKTISVLSGAGVQTGEYSLPPGDWIEVFHRHWFSGAACRLRQMTEQQRSTVDPGLVEVYKEGSRLTAVQLVEAQTQRALLGASIEEALQGCDVIISPAVSIEPFATGTDVPEWSSCKWSTEWAGFTYPINLGQQPACVIPMGLTESGGPCGLQIIGARGADQQVLNVAAAMERLIRFTP